MTDRRTMRPNPETLHTQVLAAYEGLGYPHNVVGSWAISDNDVADFVNIVAELNPRKILEVGTFVGVSTLLMALACPKARIYTVDPDFPLEVEMGALQSDTADADASITTQSLGARAAEALGVQERIEFVRGGFAVTDTFSSVTRAGGQATELVGPSLCEEHGPFDLIFVDGLHTASAVAADLELAAKWLTPRGTMVLHDCVGFWGANVRAGVSAFLRTNPDYRFTHPPFSALYKSIGVIRHRGLPRLKWEPARTPWSSGDIGMLTRDMMRSAVRMVTNESALELCSGTPVISGGRGEKKLFESLSLKSDPALAQEATTQALDDKLGKRGLGAVFSAEFADYATADGFKSLLAKVKARGLPLVLAFTPAGEAGVAGPESRPLAAIVDMAESAGLYVHTLPALNQESVRYELLQEPRELGISSLFIAMLLINDQEHAIGPSGHRFVRLTPELAAEREQQELQRVHLAAAFRHYLEKDRAAQSLVDRVQARALEVQDKSLSDAEQFRARIAALERESEQARAQFQDSHGQAVAARAQIEAFTNEKLALDVATSRLLCESEALRCSHVLLREQHDSLRVTADTLHAEGEALRAENDRLRADGEALQNEREALRLEFETAQANLAFLHNEHQRLASELSGTKDREAALQAEVASTSAALDAAKHTETALRAEVASLEARVSAISEQRAEAERLNAALTATKAAADAQLFSLIEAYTALERIAVTVGVDEPASENGAEPARSGVDRAVENICMALQSVLDENQQLKDAVDALQGSTSWRITAPIRAAVMRLRGARAH